jgi:hypothetical protein
MVAPPQANREGEALPSRAENHAHWQRERAEAHSRTKRAHSRTKRAVRELDTAIEVGDRCSRRLRHRLNDYGTQLEAARSRLRREGYLTH